MNQTSWLEKREQITQNVVDFLTFLLCVIVVFRYQILNEFSILPGDRYDAVISAVIHEHWFNVLSGRADWTNVFYFYPYGRTIAHTDAYFFNGVLYSPFRVIGFDPFLSQELSLLMIKAIGFYSILIFSRRAFKIGAWWSLVAAVLFTLSNGMTSHGSRYQLASVAFSPLLSYLIWGAVQSLTSGSASKFRIYGIFSGLLFGAWCMTSFYMAWFYLFFFLAFAISIFFIATPEARKVLFKEAKRLSGSVVVVVVSALIAVVPFVWVFFPKSREVGVRTYESVLSNTVPIEGILQTGKENLVFGQLYTDILSHIFTNYSPNGEYYNTGFSLPLFVLFCYGAFEAIKNRKTLGASNLAAPTAVAVLITWALTLNIGGFSAWYIVYHGIPGAKALNVVSAYQIFLAFPVVLVAVWFLSRKHVVPAVAWFLAGILLVSELNKPYLNLNRQLELDRVALRSNPPEECKVFYVSGWHAQENIPGHSEWANNVYAHSVSAMLIAQLTRLPTINGMASFNPPDWNLGYPNREDYDKRVYAYARNHRILGLCKFALEEKEWTVVRDIYPTRVPALGERLLFNNSGQGLDYIGGGWSHAESWGTWTDGNLATVYIPLSAERPHRIRIAGFPLLSAIHAKQEIGVRINGHHVQTIVLTREGESSFEVIVPNEILEGDSENKLLALEFVLPNAVRPLDIGKEDDPRKLAFGLVSLTLE